MYSYRLHGLKVKYSDNSFSYTILQCVVYQDPSKGKVIADSASHTAFILAQDTEYSQCLIDLCERRGTLL